MVRPAANVVSCLDSYIENFQIYIHVSGFWLRHGSNSPRPLYLVTHPPLLIAPELLGPVA